MSEKFVPHFQEWNTNNVKPNEQFSYWNDAVCEKIVGVELNRREKGSFRGTLKTYPLRSFFINILKSEGHTADLTNFGISRLKSHYYKLLVQKKSMAKVCQNGKETMLKPGDAVLIDSITPFHLDFPNNFECCSIKIPRERLRPLLKDPRAATAIPIVGKSPLCNSIKHYIHFLISTAGESRSDDQLDLFLDNLLGLISAAVTISPDSDEVSYLSRLEKKIARIERYIIDNIEDPDLSPAKVAKHFSISVSYFHKLFAKEEQTFGNFIREKRLEFAAKYLQSQLSDRYTITELAYHLGFNDLSHFWRLFRKRYGMTPRAFRVDCRMMKGEK